MPDGPSARTGGTASSTAAVRWPLVVLVAGTAVAAAGAATLLLSGGGGPDRAGEPEARLEVAGVLAGGDTAGYARAVGPRTFEFPADHGPHPRYRTEWWYLSGNLETDAGRRFGYQFTLFRVALAPEATGDGSSWSTNQAYMAHFALTDPAAERFRTDERFARGALGLAGARSSPFRVWLEDWSLAADGAEAFPARLEVQSDSAAVALRLEAGKAPVLQGEEGLVSKGPDAGNASYYYSLTRMPTRGRVVSGGDTLAVTGLSWLDREWGTTALGPAVEGWDWFSLQLGDGRDLMYYRLRRRDGTAAPESRGSWIGPGGERTTLPAGGVRLRPREWWDSPEGEVRYPLSWTLEVPSRELVLRLDPVLEDQEWRRTFRYWEGAVDVRGSRAGEPVEGRGYVELTGYGGAAPPGGG